MKLQGNKNWEVVHALSAATLSSAISSAAIDTRGFDEAIVVVNAGTAGATVSGTVFVMESPSTTAGSFSHIAGSSFTTITPTAATKASQFLSIDLRGRKRYLRVKYTTATANALTLAAVVLLGSPKVLPATHASGATDKGRI